MTQHLSRREWISGAASSVAAGQQRRPNILLVITDQQAIDTMSADGNPYLRTPHMDQIVRSGTRFRNSWCTNPVCSPARASLVTGCMPHSAGVNYLGQRLNPAVPTLGEIFRDAGYESAWAGKWHLPVPFPGAQLPGAAPALESERGFQFLAFPLKERAEIAYGDFTDEPVAEAAAAFLRKKRDRPFLLAVSLHNPHDICYWIAKRRAPAADMGRPKQELPPLPGNFARSPDEPGFIARCREGRYFGGESQPPEAGTS